MLDDHWRKAVAAVGDFSHRASLSAASLRSYPVILTKPGRLELGAVSKHGRIAEPYQLEAEIRGKRQRAPGRATRKDPAARGSAEDPARETLIQLASGSSIAQAIRYGLNHWDGLARFLDDGCIKIDSNTVERSIRPIALNRKNALFAGSDEGAENWAMLASLIE